MVAATWSLSHACRALQCLISLDSLTNYCFDTYNYVVGEAAEMTGQKIPYTQQGTLIAEVRLFDNGSRQCRSFGDREDVRSRVEDWIRCNFVEVRVGMSVSKAQLAGSPLSKETDCIEFTGHSKSRSFPDETFHSLSDNNLDILVYSLCSDYDILSQNGEDEDADSPSRSFEGTLLPHRGFEGLWQTLVYEDPVGELTLRALTRAIQEQRDCPTESLVKSWQNTVLFYGPPGSGKTTLAQALAQRLSVRLSKDFQAFKLLQISSHALFSRFYGETTKRFGELFNCISDLASDNDQLIVIIFDEVESVAGVRELIAGKNEPGETIRVCGFICALLRSTNVHKGN